VAARTFVRKNGGTPRSFRERGYERELILNNQINNLEEIRKKLGSSLPALKKSD
jgi:hypothetical protein